MYGEHGQGTSSSSSAGGAALAFNRKEAGDTPLRTTGIADPPLRSPGSGFGSMNSQKPGSACTDPAEQQCAEEECDPDECGDEKRPPLDSVDCFGNDKRPYLPVLLFSSTLFGAIIMVTLQFPMVRENFENGFKIRGFFLTLYATTLYCMVYCILSDPGKLTSEQQDAYARITQAPESEGPNLPKRCHKMWLFKAPIRRYDHYCRWLTNSIGLLNHREFVVMTAGLASIGICGTVLDIILVLFTSGKHFFGGFILLMHLTYSMILSALGYPILRLHIGFVSRNELANEWKHNHSYIIRDARTGKKIPVNELDEEEFNDNFDNERFEYDPELNPFDKGWQQNCLNFWIVSRWSRDQLGDF
eukprot:TRINITY_DN10502_c0_g3_i1.p1 TRINITY_DN10502_c0_g3~~TRINITY_DN10502_c0_g3_i1.p1  ORF type:complete len:359 (-),score=37.28 TRINITY_DN10502_c0_g3_i1:201-1277(-)